MTQYYCTLFDSFYLSRGLAMHRSLNQTSPDFHLFIFPFDNLSFQILESLKLNNVTLVPLIEFENEKLLAVKPLRSKAEYCWTCTPFVIDYCISRFQVPACTYVDADLYFYSNPEVLLAEMGSSEVLITEHRYSRRYDQSNTSGIYCVQFITFKNGTRGLTALHWWRDRCLEWCYDRFEEGKFGDQKYLDDWTTRFEGVYVLTHLGGGVAPWNVQRFQIQKKGSHFFISNSTGESYPLVFFHFHAIKFLDYDRVDLGAYDLRYEYVLELYQPYIRCIELINRQLLEKFKFATRTQKYLPGNALLRPLHKIARRFLGVYNISPLSKFIEHGATS